MARLTVIWVFALFVGWTLTSAPAQARGAIFTSDQGSTGWCTGQRNQNTARSCALDQCKKQAKGDCQLALDCNVGWAAIAFGPKTGYGILCEVRDRNLVRIGALVTCIRAVKDKCYTADAFPERGAVATKEDNKAFDETFYAQVMLGKMGYFGGHLDAVTGPALQAALIKYQQETKGLPVSGLVDDATTSSLTTAVGGVSTLVNLIVAVSDPMVNTTWSAKSWAGNQAPQSDQQKPAEQTINPLQRVHPPEIPPTQLSRQNPPPRPKLQLGQVPQSIAAEQTVETFGAFEKELDAHFASAFSDFPELPDPQPAVCAKASTSQPYICRTVVGKEDDPNLISLALVLFAPKAAANEDELARAVTNDAAYEGQLYKTTNSYSFKRKDATTEQKYDGTCYQTLGIRNSPVVCFLYLTARVALVVIATASEATTKNVNLDSGKSITPETATAKSLLLTGLAAFGGVSLPD